MCRGAAVRDTSSRPLFQTLFSPCPVLRRRDSAVGKNQRSTVVEIVDLLSSPRSPIEPFSPKVLAE